MIATISADIVRSTSLRTKDLIALRDSLHSLFVNFEKDYSGFWARIGASRCYNRLEQGRYG